MPELPEVECVRRSLKRAIVGARVVSVDVRRADVIARASDAAPAGRARTRCGGGASPRVPPGELLVGCVVADVLRRGKQLALVGDTRGRRRVLLAHLGMTGEFIHSRRDTPADDQDHIHVAWRLARPADARGWTDLLAFRDPRRFGGLTTLASVAALEEHWSHIGSDALDVSPDDLRTAARGSRRAIKALLLDQRALAGVGNIYADEALFDAAINPRTPALALDDHALERLASSIRSVLAAAVDCGGSTIRSYRDADGTRGRAQLAHRVYGRAGEPCVRCGNALVSARVGQRATVWCPTCQPGAVSRRARRPTRLST